MSEKLIPPRVVGTPEPETNADNDPELAALLEFEPVPRQVNRPDSWTPERQRRFLELIVQTGSPQQAARAMKKQLSGIESVYRDDEAGEFRASWDGICELVRTREERRLRALSADPIAEPPHRRNGLSPLPLNYPGEEGQGLNEYGEWEDEGSLHRRAEDARDSISNKLRRCRRLFLHEISGEPAKRAAFEILTELPIDWDKAAAMQPQTDEPWRKPNMRQADMLLTAEGGWLGDIAHGPDKKAELLKAVNQWRAEQGLPAVGWKGECEGEEEDCE
jgi:hypothetical protein